MGSILETPGVTVIENIHIHETKLLLLRLLTETIVKNKCPKFIVLVFPNKDYLTQIVKHNILDFKKYGLHTILYIPSDEIEKAQQNAGLTIRIEENTAYVNVFNEGVVAVKINEIKPNPKKRIEPKYLTPAQHINDPAKLRCWKSN